MSSEQSHKALLIEEAFASIIAALPEKSRYFQTVIIAIKSSSAGSDKRRLFPVREPWISGKLRGGAGKSRRRNQLPGAPEHK